jgi:hypothetical protein
MAGYTFRHSNASPLVILNELGSSGVDFSAAQAHNLKVIGSNPIPATQLESPPLGPRTAC